MASLLQVPHRGEVHILRKVYEPFKAVTKEDQGMIHQFKTDENGVINLLMDHQVAIRCEDQEEAKNIILRAMGATEGNRDTYNLIQNRIYHEAMVPHGICIMQYRKFDGVMWGLWTDLVRGYEIEKYKGNGFEVRRVYRFGPHDPEICGCEEHSDYCPYNPESETYGIWDEKDFTDYKKQL